MKSFKQKFKKINPLKEPWIFLVNRNVSFLHNWLATVGFFKYNRLYGLNERLFILALMNGFNASIYMTKIESDQFANEVLSKAQNPLWTKILKRRYQKYGNALLQSANRLAQTNIKSKNAKESILNYFKAYTQYIPTLNITAIGGAALPEN